MKLKTIFKSTEQINSAAESFLKRYWPSKKLPIQIEEIIEFQLNIDIIPIQGLKDCFKKLGLDIDAFISSNFETITVDQSMQERIATRYRFSLAHEIGHMLLHEYLYFQFRFNNINEWCKIIREIPLEDRGRVEWQADEFAGRLLVPSLPLKENYQVALREAKKYVKKSEKELLIDMAIRYFLAPKFEVSNSVIRIRSENEGLIGK